MAKAGDKPKAWKEEQEVESNIYKDPDLDKYGYDKCKNILIKNGYNSFVENGVLWVFQEKYSKDKFDDALKDVQSILEKEGFNSSWGITTDSQKKIYLTN